LKLLLGAVIAAEPSRESNGKIPLSSHVRWGERGAPVGFWSGFDTGMCAND